MTKNHKPRRWTWEELKEINPGFIDDPELLFRTNEPWTDHLEAENKQLKINEKTYQVHKNQDTETIERLMSCVTYHSYKDRVDQVNKLQTLLREAIAVIEFYGDYKNFESDDISRTDGKKCYDIILFDFERSVNNGHYAGKRARTFLQENKEAIKDLK